MARTFVRGAWACSRPPVSRAVPPAANPAIKSRRECCRSEYKSFIFSTLESGQNPQSVFTLDATQLLRAEAALRNSRQMFSRRAERIVAAQNNLRRSRQRFQSLHL